MEDKHGLSHYLVNVLGIRSLISQSDEYSKSAAQATTSHQQDPQSILVFSEQTLNEEEVSLLHKMLGAIGIKHFNQINSVQERTTGFLFVLGELGLEEIKASFADYKLAKAGQLSYAVLPELRLMLGDSEKTTQVKKQAWEILKDVQKFLES